jgi:TetR/AcrR family transcriptional repressor of nem operon
MGRRKNYERDAVLDKAMNLFWRKGYEGAHLQELVDVTGLNRFSLYKEFGGKEGLYEEAANRYLAGMQTLGAILSREPLGLTNVLDYLKALIHHDFPYGCFMINALTQQEVLNERIQAQVRDFVAHSEKSLLKNLEAAKKNGEIRPGADAGALAKALVVFDIGMVTYSLMRPSVRERTRIWEMQRELLNGQRAC